VVTKPQGVVLARARMPLCLLGLARSQRDLGRDGRCGFCRVLSWFYLVLSGSIYRRVFIGFDLALVGFGGLWWWVLVGAPRKRPGFC